MKFLRLLALLFLFAQQANAQSLRGMYINGFDAILGNTVKEDSLLHYLQDSSFNYMALYDLHTLDFNSAAEMNMLASFISRARNNFGLQYVGAVGESLSFFTGKIKGYNNSRNNTSEKFNVFNLEFEFWTVASVQPGGYYCTNYLQGAGCDCDTSGAFRYYISMLHSIDSLAATQGAISETYLGWFNEGQAKQIQQHVDRILLHAYRVDNSSVWTYSKTRLSYLASNNQTVNVAPIFSSEPIFMGPWLQDHGQSEAYNQYSSEYNADNDSWKQYINLIGYQWFDWGFMPKQNPGANGNAPAISASGSTTFCPGGSVTLTASLGDSYLWNTGATTRSVSVTTPGAFSCQVTQSANTQTSNVITVNVYEEPSVSVVVDSAVNNTVPLSSNANPGSGTISSYQWKLNGNNIGGATSSGYTATQSGNYALVATNSNGCTHSSSSAAVTVPTNNCQLSVPGGAYTDNINSSSAMLHWDPVGTVDSIVIRYKVETSSTYIYLTLPYTGQESYTLTGLLTGTEYSWKVKTVCGSTSGSYSAKKYFTTASATGIAETAQNNLEDVMVYPNPATTSIYVAINCDKPKAAQIKITEMTGKIISDKTRLLNYGDNIIETDLTNCAKGIYMLSLITETENIQKKIFIR